MGATASTPPAVRTEQIVQASQRKYWKRKRVFDFAASLLLLALSAPLLLLLAVLICLDDPRGGPIFRQTRLGLGGRRFTMYKFRTMAVDAEQRRAELADEREEWEQRKEERRALVRRQLEEWRASMQELLDQKSFGHRRLLRAFPRLRSIDHRETLERLRRRAENFKRP